MTKDLRASGANLSPLERNRMSHNLRETSESALKVSDREEMASHLADAILANRMAQMKE